MASDVDAGRDPRVAVVRNVPQYPLRRADPARPTDYAQVKPDRHHLGLVGAFAVQPIEGVDHVLRKIAGAAEPLRTEELHVVRVKGIRQHEVALAGDIDEIRQLVVVGVAVVEEAAFLDQQTPGVGRSRGPSVPADRPDAGRALYRGDGARDAAAFLRLVEPIMAFPSPAVRRDLVPAAEGIASQHWQPLDSSPGGAECRLRLVAFEKVHDAPAAGAGAVLEVAVDGGSRRPTTRCSIS